MKIAIGQTLHGYLNGHQLLSSSVNLNSEEKKILLFQSDLTGSNILDGFKTYLTGYPIKNSKYYAFARTWYANEMSRPGCVWTHTLLIEISDLGKIPELSILNNFFIRPVLGLYETYEKNIFLTEIELKKSFLFDLNIETNKKRQLQIGLFDFPQKAIVLPAENSDKFENELLSVWSDQWPRLRRNFSFCTGSLSLKKINSEDADIQVVPSSRINILLRQFPNYFIPENIDEISMEKWGKIDKYPKIKLRNFLWTYGSDILGNRANYLPLLAIFEEINSDNFSIKELSRKIEEFYPLVNQAKYLKTKIFGRDSILQNSLSEKEILKFLITADNLDFTDQIELSIDNRITDLLKNNAIEVADLIVLWNNAQPNRISNEVWNKLDISENQLYNLFKNDTTSLNIFNTQILSLIYSINFWKKHTEFQEKIIDFLVAKEDIQWEKIILILLEEKSTLIFYIAKYRPYWTVYLSLEWLNDSKPEEYLMKEWSKGIVVDYRLVFYDWLNKNRTKVGSKVFALILLYETPQRLFNLNMSAEIWISSYNTMKEHNHGVNMIYFSACTLAFGFQNKIGASSKLVKESFHDVFSYAASSKILDDIWYLIPQETDGDQEEFKIYNFFNLFSTQTLPKKNHEIENWDYCELLIRTMVNKFIRYDWSTQVFLDTQKNALIFSRTMLYCISIKKGRKFLIRINSEIKSGRLTPLPFQKEIFDKYPIDNY